MKVIGVDAATAIQVGIVALAAFSMMKTMIFTAAPTDFLSAGLRLHSSHKLYSPADLWCCKLSKRNGPITCFE
jgi:hypothetical protein